MNDVEDTGEFMRQVNLGQGYPVAVVTALIIDAEKHNHYLKRDSSVVMPAGHNDKIANIIRWRDIFTVMTNHKLYAIPINIAALYHFSSSGQAVEAYDLDS